MNGLDLFSGIGGLTEALAPWVETVAYCEKDNYAISVLLSRMEKGEIDYAPIWDDVTTLKGRQLPKIDIVTGGFPCQDISVAGAGKGLEGKRSGLFWEIIRLVSEIRPRFIFLENVPAINIRGADTVTGALAEGGYDCRWSPLSAFDVGAEHLRERWWLLAHTNGERLEGVLNEGGKKYMQQTPRNVSGHNWSPEPRVLGRDHGIPEANNRIKCLGNSVVPQCAREAFKRLMGL